jgi:hypothetical protein
MFRYVFLATISLLAMATSLQAQPASPPTTSPPAVETPNGPLAMEDPQTGDHWTYEVRDDITGDVKSTTTYTVTEASSTDVSIRFSILGNANFGLQIFDHSWNLTNNGIWRYSPSDGTGIRTPLAADKSWTIKGTDFNTTTGFGWKRTGTSKVIARESITTRAGTFDTFKIETSLQFQAMNDPTKKYTGVLQTWYAPAIDHWVKRTYVSRFDGHVREKNTNELVEYGRR